MKNITHLFLLAIIFYSCSYLPCFLDRNFCTDIRTAQFESTTPGGTVHSVLILDTPGDNCNSSDIPTITYTEGPAGLETSIYCSDYFKYDGKLRNGNDFGECKIIISGKYPQFNKDYASWVRHGILSISKPSIILKPKTIYIDPLGSHPYYATILPFCKYTVEISNPDSTLKISPRSPCTTYKSTLSLVLKDLKGVKRTSTVILTINSNCDSSAITDSLNVIVM